MILTLRDLTMYLSLCSILLACIHFADATGISSLYHLRVFPSEDVVASAREQMKAVSRPCRNNVTIPCHLWVTGRHIGENSSIPRHLKALLSRNHHWNHHLVDNEAMDAFMSTHFNETMIHWAYSMTNPILGAALADIWRMAALWMYGGVYIDYDSDIKTPLDQVETVELFVNTHISVLPHCSRFSSLFVTIFHVCHP